MSSNGFSRRQLLQGALAASALSIPGVSQAAALRIKKKPKNIIYLVSDGCSIGMIAMLNQYMQRIEGKAHSPWHSLMMDPKAVHGLMDTRSLSTLVTDSAAASSSWGSGVYCWNGMINTLPDKTELTCLYQILKGKAKMKTGLVSTVTITHATPAGFASSIDHRSKEPEIAIQFLKNDVDVIMGGGRRFFEAETRIDKKDLVADYQKNGYSYVKDLNGLNAATGVKLLGLFAANHLPYEADRRFDKSVQTVPNLAQMTTKALATLHGSKEGFILQVEGGKIDWAAHANDFAGGLFEQHDFEKAVEVALEYARKHGDTLVIVTSDHGNANPGLIGAGKEYFDSPSGLDSVKDSIGSYETLMPMLNKSADANGVRDVIELYYGFIIKTEEAEMIYSAIKSNSSLKSIVQYALTSSILSLVLSNYYHVNWSGRQHSSDLTVLTAFGPGAEAFAGLNQNIEIFGKLLAMRGLEFKNPSMSYEDALKFRASNEKASIEGDEGDLHWI